MILSLLNLVLLKLYQGWNLISGQLKTPQEFQVENSAGCNLSVMWHFNQDTQLWDGYFPNLDLGLVFIPEFFSRLIYYMNPYDAYWVFCK